MIFEDKWNQISEKNYIIISPYILPKESTKKINIGDGFILDSAVRLIGFKPKSIISSRSPLSEIEISQINESQFVLVAGANTLKDDFEIVPNFELATLNKIKVPIVLFGLGHYGIKKYTENGLTKKSFTMMSEILERFPYISVRCDQSLDYLKQSLSIYSEKLLMTSCPVIFPVESNVSNFEKKDVFNQLVVTVTDRAKIENQLEILKIAPNIFPSGKRILALHQDYNNQELWKIAESYGYKVFKSENYEDFIDLYRQSDIHFGNRVHAHLKCISLGIRSFLTPYDLRQLYFSQSLDFPLITNSNDGSLNSFDFNRILTRRKQAQTQMNLFLREIRTFLN